MIKVSMKREEILAFFIVVAAVFLRVLPHPDNFVPVTAMALFGGAVFSPGIALTVPLIVMILSDLIVGPHDLYLVTWGSFVVVSLMGVAIRKDFRPRKIFMATLAGSVFFFVATNLAVFFFQDMYAKNWEGLWTCFAMALPFFRNSILGDIFYAVLFFGVFAAVKSRVFKPSLSKIKS